MRTTEEQRFDMQERILRYIKYYFAEHGYAPALHEIGKAVGASVSTVQKHFNRLFDEGLLETDVPDRFSVSRAYRVARRSDDER